MEGFGANMTTVQSSLTTGALLLLSLLACGGCKGRGSDKPIGTVVEIKAPLGLPPVPVPVDNPPTAETIALARAASVGAIATVRANLAKMAGHPSRASLEQRLWEIE